MNCMQSRCEQQKWIWLLQFFVNNYLLYEFRFNQTEPVRFALDFCLFSECLAPNQWRQWSCIPFTNAQI